MKKFLSICLLLFPFTDLISQKKIIDSLELRLKSAATDSIRLTILDHLSFQYSREHPDKGLRAAEEAEKIAVKISSERGLAGVYTDFGLNYAATFNYQEALKYYLKALEKFEKLGDKGGKASVLANISGLYLSQSNYTQAMNYGLQALTLLEETGNHRSIAVVQENIGTIYLEQNNFDKTLFYYSKAFEHYKKINDLDGIARNTGNQGIVLNGQGRFDEALKLHMIALKANEENGQKGSAQMNLANIGLTYFYKKDYQTALDYHLKALAISEELKDKKSIAINLGNAGEAFLLLAGETTNAEKRKTLLDRSIVHLTRSVELCQEINFRGPVTEFAAKLSEAYVLAGNYQEALQAYKLCAETKDSVYASETRLKLAALETKREADLKDRDIILKNQQLQISILESVNKKNERIIYISGIVLMAVVIVMMYGFYRRRSRGHKRVLAEIAVAQSHEVRAPLARLLGLTKLFDPDNPSSQHNKEIIGYIDRSANELDDVIRKIVSKSGGSGPVQKSGEELKSDSRIGQFVLNTSRRFRDLFL